MYLLSPRYKTLITWRIIFSNQRSYSYYVSCTNVVFPTGHHHPKFMRALRYAPLSPVIPVNTTESFLGVLVLCLKGMETRGGNQSEQHF